MRKTLLLSLFIAPVLTAAALADPLNAPRAAQPIANAPHTDAGFDPAITGTVSQRDKKRRYRAQRQQPQQEGDRSDFADSRSGAVRPGSMGGGFIEFLFGGAPRGELPRASGQRPWEDMARGRDGYGDMRYDPMRERYEANTRTGWGNPYDQPRRGGINPKYFKQLVEYPTQEKPGTIIIDTPNRFLYLVQEDGKAIRYGIGVGRPGFEWAGIKSITAMKEWPDWRPPVEMLKRRPDLPTFMAGGPQNPLGARAMYLGSTLYRIHGSNEPDTIGTAVSSGCIRMRNEDVIDLYEKVRVGTKVVVI
jgi:lipoprotein-anchoring transpeptidase ErfK/SrfK